MRIEVVTLFPQLVEAGLVVGGLGADGLQGDEVGDALAVPFGEEHDAHAAAADLAVDRVARGGVELQTGEVHDVLLRSPW